jgi:hypothetical protein
VIDGYANIFLLIRTAKILTAKRVCLALGTPLMRNRNYCSASGRGLVVVAALVLSAGADGSAGATEDSAGAVDGFG